MKDIQATYCENEIAIQKFYRLTTQQISGLLAPGMLATILPLLLLLGLWEWLVSEVLKFIPVFLQIPLTIFFPCLIIARFAIPVRNDRIADDLYDQVNYGIVFQTGLRLWVLLALLWIPLVAIAHNFFPSFGILLRFAGFSLPGRDPLPVSLSLLVLSVVLLIISPVVASLVALQTRNWNSLRPALLKIVFVTYREQTIIVLSTWLGALSMCFLLFLPLHTFFALLSGHWYLWMARAFMVLALGLPLVASLVVLGRLSGLFAQLVMPIQEKAENLPQEIFKEELVTTPSEVSAHFLEDPISRKDLEWQSTLNLLKNELERNPAGAAQAAASLIQIHEGNADLLYILVQSHLRSGNKQAALDLAPVAANSLMQENRREEAADLFVSLGKERHNLPWPPQVLRPLSRVFQHRGKFRESGWCAHQANLDGQDGVVDRAIIDIAEAAGLAHKGHEAIALYEFYLKAHPEGPFQEFAKKAIEFQKRLLASE